MSYYTSVSVPNCHQCDTTPDSKIELLEQLQTSSIIYTFTQFKIYDHTLVFKKPVNARKALEWLEMWLGEPIKITIHTNMYCCNTNTITYYPMCEESITNWKPKKNKSNIHIDSITYDEHTKQLRIISNTTPIIN